jgi:hypothetical protein
VRRLWVIAVIALGASTAAADTAEDAGARLAAERLCAAHDPRCDWIATFAVLEQQTLRRALESRHYTLDPEPWGKTIGEIHMYVEDPFAEKNWLQFANFFHFTTREHAIRNELTIDEGQVWDQTLVEESARRLHDPLYSSVVVLVPIKSAEAGKVDLFVVTRDVFSLRLNTQYTIQQGSLTALSISISENNFLGQRDLAAMRVTLDQGAIAVGPLFIDKNLFGSHLDFRVAADEILTRQNLDVVDPVPQPPGCGVSVACQLMTYPTTDPKGIQDGGGIHEEGKDLSISLTRPLWSLASEWGGGGSFSYSDSIARQFLSTGIRGFDDPNSTTGMPIPREWRQKSTAFAANALRAWGTDYKHQVTVGYTYTNTQVSLLPNFPADPQLQADFAAAVLPRSERISSPYIGYSMYEPRYKTVRNTTSYELAEDLRLGPSVDFALAWSLRSLGSDYHFTRPSLSFGWTFPWCHDGSIGIGAGGSIRIQPFTLDGKQVDTIDNSASANLRVVSPGYRYFRIVSQASIATIWNSSQGQFLSIGGDPLLRGYIINQFVGQRRAQAQIEARSMPFPLWVFRVGVVGFYEVGGATDTFSQMGNALFHDIGIGVRALIPQTSRDLFRVDVAFPLQATPDNGAAFFPHLVLSFASAF